MNSKKQIDPKTITKSELTNLYFEQKLNKYEIGRYFGFSDAQPINRLFKKFGIKARSKAQLVRLRHPFPEKQYVLDILGDMSISACAKKHNIRRGMISSWMKYHNITTEYFVNDEIKDLILSDKFKDNSPQEIATTLGTTTNIVKYYKKTFTQIQYTKDALLDKIKEYKIDLDNQGAARQIRTCDINVYNSIIELTRNHNIQSRKITERLYRIANDYTEDQIDCCKYCGATLKFYTYYKGYGNSTIGMCKSCLQKHNGFGVSRMSQKFFDMVFSKLIITSTDKCMYYDLNEELQLFVENKDIVVLRQHAEHLNKLRYSLDFVFNNKVIEFDGTYYHKDHLKEQAKDAFLKHKGFDVIHIKEEDFKIHPEQEIKKCLVFLNL